MNNAQVICMIMSFLCTFWCGVFSTDDSHTGWMGFFMTFALAALCMIGAFK